MIAPFFIKINSNYRNFYYSYHDKSYKKRIRIAFYNNCFKYGGIERVTSILLKYFSKEKCFTFYLITIMPILEDEYSLPNNIERISLNNQINKLFDVINEKKIDILINNMDNKLEIEKLNKLNNTKVIHCTHSSFFYRIYGHAYNLKKTVYSAYKNCKYVIALIPLENDYLFKKWGINSIIIENPSTYEYDLVTPSNLSKKNIIMIGRGDYYAKRFELGITAMKFIIKEIPECQMNIVSAPYENIKKLISNLDLEQNVKIVGFHKNPEPYLKISSLHIFPSLSEAYPMVLGEVKIFGIPSILCGLDYIILAKGGTIIIYDDNPETIAKESIKVLKNEQYRKKLGKEARKSMEKYKNEYIVKKWKKLFFNIYMGLNESSYSNLFNDYYKPITEKEADIILKNQLDLLRKRIPKLNKINIDMLKSYNLE